MKHFSSSQLLRQSFCLAILCSVACYVSAPAQAASITGISTSQIAIGPFPTPPYRTSVELVLETVTFSDGRGVVPESGMVGVSEIFFFRPRPALPTVRDFFSPQLQEYYPPGERHRVLTHDASINTGLGNVGFGSGLMAGPLDLSQRYGLGISFERQVLNGPGTDIVVSTVTNGSFGKATDVFYSSAISGETVLGSSGISLVSLSMQYENMLDFPSLVGSPAVYAQNNPIESMIEFELGGFSNSSPPAFFPYSMRFYEIDLTDLGVPEGGTVDRLFFQSSTMTSFNPAFIAGLYHAPEPGSFALMGFGLAAVAASRRFSRCRVRA